MTLQEKKDAIQKAIFERAYELEQAAEEMRGVLFPKNASAEEISGAALRQAIRELKENKPVFTL